MSIFPEAGDHDAGLRASLVIVRLAAVAGAGHRIDRDHDVHEWLALAHAGRIDQIERPEGSRHVGEHFGQQLLPTDARAFVAADDLLAEGRGEVLQVLVRGAPGDVCRRVLHQGDELLARLGGGGHHRSGMITETQAEQEVVEGLVVLER